MRHENNEVLTFSYLPPTAHLLLHHLSMALSCAMIGAPDRGYFDVIKGAGTDCGD